MSHPRRALRVLSVLTLATLAPSQVSSDVAIAIKREGLENSQVMAYLDYLTNNIGHRLTGSANYVRAVEWAKGEFEQMGLEVELEKWATWRNSWNRGQWSGRVVSPVELELQIATPAWTAGTKGLVRGKLVAMPTDEAQPQEIGDSLRGAYVFDLSSIPDYEPAVEASAGGRRGGGGGRGRGGVPAWLRDAAPALGIAGFVSSSSGTAQYPNRIRVFADRGQPYLARTLPTIPEIVVRQDQAKKLRWLMAHSDEDVQIEFDIRNRFQGEVDLYNVVAELKGTEKPDEYVVVCGHLDSWHQATGATDNGTGTTSTLEAARILTAIGAKPKRTIRFCLWGGEEQGLIGSSEHVNRRRDEMAKVSCVLNHDTGTNWAQSLTVTESMLPHMQMAMAEVMTMTAPDKDHDGPVFELTAQPTISSGGGSDHASFGRAGVPPFGWGLTGRSDYFGYTWHSQWDRYDVVIPEYQTHTSTVIALTALGIANLPDLLPRDGITRGRGNRRGDATTMFSGALGVELDGMKFKSVGDTGTAGKAGIQVGDTIVEVNGKPVTQMAEIFGILREREGGRLGGEIELTLQRGDEKVKTKLTPFAGRRGTQGRRRDG